MFLYTHNKPIKKNPKQGFTLLEVIIAIFVVLVGVTATSVLITRTVGQMSVSSSKLIASYLTQEGIEIVRNIRDTNWLEGDNWDNGLIDCSTGCEADYTATTEEDPVLSAYVDSFLYIDNLTGFYKYGDDGDDIETRFKRKITIEQGAGILTVTVETLWREKGKDYSHTAQEILYNWK